MIQCSNNVQADVTSACKAVAYSPQRISYRNDSFVTDVVVSVIGDTFCCSQFLHSDFYVTEAPKTRSLHFLQTEHRLLKKC